MKRVFVLLTIALLIVLTPAVHAQQNNDTATVVRSANLRGGPGTNFAVAGSAAPGDTVTIVGCNSACDWYELANGTWIAAFLVERVATADRGPAATATPVTTPPAPTPSTANRNANLRGGPGTTYAVVGSVQQGQTLRISGRNPAGDWVQLDSGSWIAAFLVNGVPTGLNVMEAPALPTPAPAPPTATPVPAQPVVPPQPAAPSGEAKVVIGYIFYDGLVSRVESDEYAEIANVGTAAINLGGWRLNAGDNGQDFRFPSVELAPGQSIRVYTNQIHPESGGFSFGKGSAIWNNRGDCGLLFDGGGQVVAERCY